MGTLRCELFADKAPLAVANFVGLATGKKAWTHAKTGAVVRDKPFYDGLVFHRVIPQFMIQGGDPTGTGRSGPGYTFADEPSDLRHESGTLSMANAGPGTNGSQFFITEVTARHLDGRHTIFGRCKEVDIVIAIGSVAADSNNRPTQPVTIRKIRITRAP
ncbi:MAG: peptidylprolyl isomerase [Deltaproteobacteria bacterium]|nr:peptidylprolyl isomerase [Deltaproteobacteria bacterium]